MTQSDEDRQDIADADAAMAEGGDSFPFGELEDEFGLDVDATGLTDEQAAEMLKDGMSHPGDWEFWRPAIRGAIRDAIACRTPWSDDEETADAISLWRQCASDLGIDLDDNEGRGTRDRA
jgi:hypothetical protein